jgi:ADP-heptose:LPS heptosyltransferase
MKLLLRNHQSPGDVLMLTAAVRDLHRAHPSMFTTSVETSCPLLWENNPWVIRPEELGGPDRVVDCGYPLVHESNRRPFHFIHGFAQDLERQLGVSVPVTDFRGDLYLAPSESTGPSPVEEVGYSGPYWVVVCGGKLDLTTKWWPTEYFQAVVDHFAGRVQFVQCGAGGRDQHPPLRRVLSLVGRTSVREFVRVVHRADGVLCPVTFAMHLAAAVPTVPGRPPLRPCVVVAGGREPSHWEMYPHHQFLHTIGALDCCATGGCWKSRCQPVGDGAANDLSLCARPQRAADAPLLTPQCMNMITPRRVIDALELYLSRSDPVPTREQSASEGSTAQLDPAVAVPDVAEPEVVVRSCGVAVTIGTGPFESMAPLAAREVRALTGLETVVLGAKEFAASGLSHPSLLKFRIFDLIRADNVLYFDADMVCLERWDPRRYFGDRAIIAVRERMLDTIRQEASDWGMPAEEYFNAGMFIASAAHHRPWLRLAESLYPAGGLTLFDQSPLNAARHRLGVPIRMLDRRYNWLGFGGNSLSLDAPVVMAHKLVPHRVGVNLDYLEGRYDLFRPSLVMEDSEAARLAGKSFVFVRDGQACETAYFREDGTVLPAVDADDAGYWFVHLQDHRPTLALASETAILHEFVELLGGNWTSVGADGLRLIDERFHRNPPLTEVNARPTADRFVSELAPCPVGRFRGRGIVICGGGQKYLPCAWVCIHMLRHLGCALPIELWQLRATEGNARVAAALAQLGVRCINAAEVRRQHPARYLGGWELKPYSILHSEFEQVLYLDADNVPVADPSRLFDVPQFAEAGAVFWPDYGRLGASADIWRVCGVPFRDEPEFESGQILVDKRRCWEPLQLTMHLNENSDFYYRYVHGDKDTFHLAWHMLEQAYAMVPHPIQTLEGTMCQHDFDGRRLFQHRNLPKWSIRNGNPRVNGFAFEQECLRFLGEFVELTR